MEQKEPLRVFVLCVFAGVIAGTAACNLLFFFGLADAGKWYEGHRGLAEAMAGEETFLQLLFLRLLRTAALLLICSGGKRRPGADILLFAVGCFFAGRLSLYTWNRGLAGSLIGLVTLIPSCIVYLPVLFLLVMRAAARGEVRRLRLFAAVFALTLVACFLEARLASLLSL
ncbi:MAG: hypothetical protein LUC99_06465 [Clostridiales bacterium]|nr:hypothetical protein [Clostridiales bacterium]